MVTKKLIAKKQPKVPHMVYVENGGAPRYVHESEADAVKEAKRLANDNPNRLVRVLKVTKQFMGKVNVEAVSYEFADLDDQIPF